MLIYLFICFVFHLYILHVSSNILENFVDSNYLSGLSQEDLSHLIEISKNISIDHPDKLLPFVVCMGIDGPQALNLRIANLENSLNVSLPILGVERDLDRVCMHALTTRNAILLSNLNHDFDYSLIPSIVKVHSDLIYLVGNDFQVPSSYSRFTSDDLLVEIQFSSSTNLVNAASLSDRLNFQRNHFLNALNVSRSRSESFGSYRSWFSLSQSCDSMPSIDPDEIQNIDDYIEFEIKPFLSYPVECLKIFVENLGNNPHIIRLSLKTKPKVLNHVSRGITQSGKSFNEPYSLAGLDGINQIVGIADSGLNDLSCFYYDHNYKNPTPRQLLSRDAGVSSLKIDRTRRKVIQYVYNIETDGLDDEGGHGTHCAGSVAGNCLGDGNMNGMAPEAKLAFYDIGLNGADFLSISPSLTAILQTAFNTGARIHSNSWGGGTQFYDSNSRTIDTFQYNNPYFLTIIAAGNDGSDGFGTTSTPAFAKNDVTVGAASTRIGSSDQEVEESTIAYFSSLGPTNDGRFYIDIVAPGDPVMSAMAGDPNTLNQTISNSNGTMQSKAVLEMSGTSMATPTVAGTAALIRQYFMESKFWASVCLTTDVYCKAFEPTAALLKALIVNSGTPVKRYSSNIYNRDTRVDTRYLGPPPDEFQGYGMITLSNILPLKDGTGLIPDMMLCVYDQLRFTKTGMSYQFIVSIDDATAVKGLPIKLSIVWNDVPYNGALGKTLVNDFDCAIITPSNAVYMGNKNPKGDNVNTVEQIYLIAGETGDYTIYVTAKVLTVSSMDVSIALTYPKSSKSVTGPIESKTFPISSSGNFITSSPTSVPVSPPDVTTTITNSYGSAYYINFDTDLTPGKDPVQIGQFNATGKLRYIDFRVTNGLSFISQQLAAVLITAPNGLRAQVGGSPGWFAYDDNIYVRYWGPSSTGFGRFEYNVFHRDLNGSELQSFGSTNTQWTISLQMGTSNTTLVPSPIRYQGTVTFYIDDGTIDDDDQSSGGLGRMATILLAIFIPLFVVAGICFYFYHREKMSFRCFGWQARPSAQQSSAEVPNPMVINANTDDSTASSIPMTHMVNAL